MDSVVLAIRKKAKDSKRELIKNVNYERCVRSGMSRQVRSYVDAYIRPKTYVPDDTDIAL